MPACLCAPPLHAFTPTQPHSHLPACLSEPPIYPSPATPNSTLTRPASAAWSSPFLTPPARRTGESWNVSLSSHKGSASGAEASDEGGAGAPDASGGERHTSLASAPRSFVRSMTVALHAPSSRLRGYSTPLPSLPSVPTSHFPLSLLSPFSARPCSAWSKRRRQPLSHSDVSHPLTEIAISLPTVILSRLLLPLALTQQSPSLHFFFPPFARAINVSHTLIRPQASQHCHHA